MKHVYGYDTGAIIDMETTKEISVHVTTKKPAQ